MHLIFVHTKHKVIDKALDLDGDEVENLRKKMKERVKVLCCTDDT